MGVFTSDQHKPSVCYEGLEQDGDGPPILGSRANQPSTPSGPKVMELEEDPAIEPNPLDDWRTLYLDCHLHETLPTDKTEARRLAHRAKSFILVEGDLYKQNLIRILQLCIPLNQGKPLVSDIHGGVCGHHAAPRTLVGNAF